MTEVTQMTFSCLGKDGPRNTTEEGGSPCSVVLGNFPTVGDQEGCKASGGWGMRSHRSGEVWEEQGRGSHSLVYGAW